MLDILLTIAPTRQLNGLTFAPFSEYLHYLSTGTHLYEILICNNTLTISYLF
jgi:hypothetical protein